MTEMKLLLDWFKTNPVEEILSSLLIWQIMNELGQKKAEKHQTKTKIRQLENKWK